MANKKVSQLTSKPSVLTTDLFPIADPSTGQLYKTTISDLGTAIGSGVSSVNTLVGAVVLDTDDIQELVSPTNKWFTDTRARAAISGGTGISYNSGTGVITNAVTSGQIATALGYTPANDASVVKLTGDQTIAGQKTFSAGSSFDGGIKLKENFAFLEAGYVGIAGVTGGIRIGVNPSYYSDLIFSASSSHSYTFPSATGTIALTSNLSAYQPLLTNPVTGTGTSGIVAKFSGTSAITDSIIYDNGTRVSIGADVTTSNKFTAVASTSSSYAVVAQASGAANGFWATLSGTGEIFRGQTSGGSYFIINNGGNAFLNGNLNIGDFASTSYRLNVVGTANITGALSGTSASFVGGTGGLNFTSSTTITNTASSGFTAIYANGGGIYLGGSASTNHLSILSSGSIGINTTSPTQRLEVVSNNVRVAATDTTNGTAGFYMRVQNGGTTVSNATIRTDNAGLFSIFTGTTGENQSLNITSSGNVGIGTTAPSDKLNVVVGSNGNVVRFDGPTSGLIFQTNATTTDIISYGGSTPAYRALNFSASASTNMTITTSGNVGIGTTAPGDKLTIVGTSSYTGVSIDTGSTTGGAYIAVKQNGVSSGFFGGSGAALGDTSTDLALYAEGGKGIRFYTNANSADRMRITSVGNVGIGNTGDGNVRLFVTGQDSTSAQFSLILRNSSATNTFLVRNDAAIFAPGIYNFTTGTVSNVVVFSDGSMQRSTVSSKRFKDNITDWNASGLNTILALKPKEFTYKKDYYNYPDKKFLGLIAEEVAEVSSYLADFANEDGSGQVENVRYANIVVPLIKAVQEQQVQIQELKQQLANK